MKKIILFILLIFPFSVKANQKVIAHYIDAEIEIAGALNIKELIVVEGDTNTFSRTINYKNNNKDWDKSKVNFKNSAIYNGYSLENIKVSAFDAPKEIEFGSFNNSKKEYFKELDLKNKTENYYTKVNNELGANINIGYGSSKTNKTAYYIEYLVTNVIVAHEDVHELNYTFLNLDYGAKETLIRVILPYSTDSDLFKIWLHGPSNGKLNYLVNSSKDNIGVISSFPNLNSQVNFRITLPKEHIGIDIYLDKTNEKALPKIIAAENLKIKNDNMNKTIFKVVKVIIITLSILYVVGAISILKTNIKYYEVLYLVLGAIITLFNYIYKVNILYIYFIILFPIGIIIIKRLKNKKMLKR